MLDQKEVGSGWLVWVELWLVDCWGHVGGVEWCMAVDGKTERWKCGSGCERLENRWMGLPLMSWLSNLTLLQDLHSENILLLGYYSSDGCALLHRHWVSIAQIDLYWCYDASNKLFRSYVGSRQHSVSYCGAISDKLNVTCGVPRDQDFYCLCSVLMIYQTIKKLNNCSVCR